MSQDPDALGEIFQAHQSDVRQLCRRMLGDEHGAEDAAGETFLRTQQRLDSYDPSRPMRPWLLGIAALPAKYRLPLVLRHFADLDYEAIAELLDTSRGQVGTLLFRAKRRLRADLADKPGGEPG